MTGLKFAVRQLLKTAGFGAVAALGSDITAMILLSTRMHLSCCHRVVRTMYAAAIPA